MTTTHLNLDVWLVKKFCVRANQGEVNSRFLEITLTDKGVPIDLTGKTVIFYATKPDGNVIYNLCTLENAEYGVISVCLTSQMSAVAGKMPCEIHILDTNASTLKIIGLELEIVKCADVGGAVESTSEFTALQEAMSEFSTAEIKIDEHIADKNNPHEVTVVQIGAVPTSRTINSKLLSSDIALNYSDVGAVPTNRTINSKELSSDIILSASDVGAVPTSRTVNSKALSSNVTLSASDVGAAIYEVKNSTDFNEMKTPGLYTMRSSTTNAPTSGSYHSLIVNKSDTGNYVQQLAIKEGTTQMYIRYGSSSWGAWKKFALSEEVPVHESGTWTPVMEFWGLDQYDGTYTTSNANYFKIGNVVHIQCRVQFTSATASSHNISLNGLPYVSSGYSAGNFNLNSDAGMQGTDYKSGIFRIAKNNYGTFDNLGTSDIANNRHLTISATYFVS